MEQRKSLSRSWERERTNLLGQIDNLNDRLMYLVGRAWTVPMRPEEEKEDEGEVDLEAGDWSSYG